jgi:hypothetical protein
MEVGQNLASPAEATAPEAKPQNFFSRLLGVYFSPGETFAEIGRAPQLLLPILAALVLGLIVSIALTQRLDLPAMYSQLFQQAVADGKMQQEQADQQAKFMASFGKVQFLIFGTLGNLLAALIVAGIFKLVSAVMGKQNRFKTIFTVTLYTFLAVGIVSSVLFVLLIYLKDPSEITFQNMGNLISSNLGAILALVVGENALPKFVMGLAQRVDIFSIWIITLLSIGYAAVTPKLKTSTAATWLVGLYVVYAVIAAAFGAMFG